MMVLPVSVLYVANVAFSLMSLSSLNIVFYSWAVQLSTLADITVLHTQQPDQWESSRVFSLPRGGWKSFDWRQIPGIFGFNLVSLYFQAELTAWHAAAISSLFDTESMASQDNEEIDTNARPHHEGRAHTSQSNSDQASLMIDPSAGVLQSGNSLEQKTCHLACLTPQSKHHDWHLAGYNDPSASTKSHHSLGQPGGGGLHSSWSRRLWLWSQRVRFYIQMWGMSHVALRYIGLQGLECTLGCSPHVMSGCLTVQLSTFAVWWCGRIFMKR